MVLYEIYREDGGNGITFVHMLYTECKTPDHFPTNLTVTSGVIFSTRPGIYNYISFSLMSKKEY
jgi:hypothetical protein